MMRNLLGCLFVMILLVSCDANNIFDEYQSIPNNRWNKDHILKFQVEVQDTISKNNVFVNLRNNNDYEFSNLFLIAKIQFPNGLKITDTLEYEMTDVSGKWLGSGFTDVKENKLFYKENVIFPVKGNYLFELQQAMRKNGDLEGVQELDGIIDVGLRIESIQQ